MSKPIKIGVVGLGRIGMDVHKKCLAQPDKFTVVAACDLIEERCNEFEETFGCRTYTNIEDMIADPEVEVVDIATRSCDHYIHSKMALLAGKSVLVEKPFCQTYAQAKELVRLGLPVPGSLCDTTAFLRRASLRSLILSTPAFWARSMRSAWQEMSISAGTTGRQLRNSAAVSFLTGVPISLITHCVSAAADM